MQPIGWYLNRLRTMSPSEIRWRFGGLLRDGVDRWRVATGTYPGPEAAISADASPAPPFRLTDVAVGKDTKAAIDQASYARLIERADDVLGSRLTFFNLDRHYLGDPVDWNRDHESGRAAPTGFAPIIDYRDYKVTGDAKVVWEPNRHQHLVVLARAYRATGNRRYAEAVLEQVCSWLDQCPYGTGMNWRSPLELGVRLINWVWAFDLIHEAGLLVGPVRARVLHAVYLHLWEITRKYSRASSANNHLVGEAAGVFIASSYFPELTHSVRWREESRRILLEQIDLQTYGDGCNREHAFGYHLFVLQFFLYAGTVARRSGRDLSSAYWSVVERMIEFAARMSDAGPAPMYGDADDGYVLDLGAPPEDVDALRAIGAILFERGDLKAAASRFREPAWWMFGKAGLRRFNSIQPVPPRRLESRAFPEAGYYLLQSGGPDATEHISVFFDCADLGFGAIAAHGHADALSFTLRAFGRDVFVDPGTYDYFTFPEWREYYRSTRAHNTVAVDEEDQSTMRGPFMWGRRARARCLNWSPLAEGGRVVGAHDGYTRLADPVWHERAIALDGEARLVTITDELKMRGVHRVDMHFHLAEGCQIVRRLEHECVIAVGPHRVSLRLDERLTLSIPERSDAPDAGWVSRGYHRRSPATILAASCTTSGDSTFVSRIAIEPVRTASDGGCHGASSTAQPVRPAERSVGAGTLGTRD